MEAVFFRRGESSRVVVCPLADSSLIEGLGRRGYRIASFEDILTMPPGRYEPEPSTTPLIEVRQTDPAAEAELYARVVAPNFVPAVESTDSLMETMANMLAVPHVSSFLACIDGEAVGGGALFIHRGLALLAGAATLPAYRNRGVHAALHRARLEFAIRLGCDLAAQGAQPGTTSHRNAERRGLRVAYTRALLVRDPA
jgi:GNAT superfamily N-acetyltransferase